MRKGLILLTYLFFLALLIVPLGKMIASAGAYGLSGLLEVLSSREVLHALYLSGLIAVIVTLLNTLFGVGLALLLVRGTRWNRRIRQVLNSMVDLPFAVSPVIGGLMILLLFGPQTVLGTFFESIGAQIVFALPGMIIATLFVTFPLMVREVMPVLQEAGTDQEEAAYTLGASGWLTFRRVTWPSIRFGVLYGVVLTVARSLGEFGAVLVVSGNIINKTQTATTLVYQEVENFHFVAANGVAVVLAALSILILLLLEWAKHRKEGIFHADSGT
ncbi:sulfate transport system permease protein [Tumebacillus sp. BK434]|uniref:sulfate ABC transporter permease subunit n=1 Tax=Tumebacillus sp. BK434 TaxID=2512169 RepID=UPI0010482461|nr:sulfate ABC transporter permease subunit [Tumebacillus sp. BK434]TCP58988.1 sulfate transport system permease protein [Tumebacillus sp. BK434]